MARSKALRRVLEQQVDPKLDIALPTPVIALEHGRLPAVLMIGTTLFDGNRSSVKDTEKQRGTTF